MTTAATNLVQEGGPTVHGDFLDVVDELGCSLIISTYKSGQIIVLGSDNGRLRYQSYRYNRPMGIAVQGSRLALAANESILFFSASQREGEHTHSVSDGYDALFVLDDDCHCGALDVHDVAWAGDSVLAVNTLYSCVNAVEDQFQMTTRWSPPFISEMRPEDRCHLNGLAIDTSGNGFVTALGRSDVETGWRPNKSSGGILMDLASGDVVSDGLSMPHSPRMFGDQLYLLNSGEGEILRVDPVSGKTEVIATLPGFLRGLALLHNYLFVGLSRLRSNRTIGDLGLEARIGELKCGVAIVEALSGRLIGLVDFAGIHEELYDVVVIPGMRFPAFDLGF